MSTRLYETADGKYVDADAYDVGMRAGLQRAVEIADSVGHRSDGAKHVAAILRSELAGTEVPR